MTDASERLYERLLVVRCQSGEDAAFLEIVERYQPRLWYFVVKILGRTRGADDVLQDVWLDVFRGLPKLKDAGAFPAWAFRIARDRVCRELRRPRAVNVQSAEIEGVEDVTPDDAEFCAEDVAMVHACLDEISSEHREVLVLRFLQDMSYEQIAGVVGCEVGTVRSRLHYAKGALRRAMERKRP